MVTIGKTTAPIATMTPTGNRPTSNLAPIVPLQQPLQQPIQVINKPADLNIMYITFPP